MKKYNITVNGTAYAVEVEDAGSAPSAVAAPAPAAPVAAAPAAAAPKAPPAAGAEVVSSPMPGTILDVKVTPGQVVSAGDILVILEAMKMENEIMAAADGTVDTVPVVKGASVEVGDVLVTMK
ncbi:MAG: biotin/lipoyl-containing protein [Anaerovoracaceae bacterium]